MGRPTFEYTTHRGDILLSEGKKKTLPHPALLFTVFNKHGGLSLQKDIEIYAS